MFRRTIAISTLDIILGNRFAGKKMLIKIDVEGTEYPVLLGATSVLCMHPKPTWLLEICSNEFHPEGMNPDFQRIFDLFWKYGYEARMVGQSNRPIQRADVAGWVKEGRGGSGTINYRFDPVGGM